jgi:hypothetical protein
MLRFEIYGVIASFCLIFSCVFIDNNTILIAVLSSFIGLIMTFLVKNEFETARWEISHWNKALPTMLSGFTFVFIMYYGYITLIKFLARPDVSNGVITVLIIVNSGTALFLVYAFIFSKPGDS